MYQNLETYLEEIGHFLPDRMERQEILAEIRSLIMEKAEQESGTVTEASLAAVIAGHGQPRQVAEKYLEGRPIIAPAFKRLLFRYTSLLFSAHFLLTLYAVIFKKIFVMFPFLFMPRLEATDAVMYLPMAFLADFGFVALVLYFITQNGKEVRLPWPRFAVDLYELQAADKKTLAAKIGLLVPAVLMLVGTGVLAGVFTRFKTIFFASLDFENFRPLLTPGPGRRISLIVIALLAMGSAALFAKALCKSKRIKSWIDVATDAVALVLIGLLLRQPFAGLFAVRIAPALLPKIKFSLAIALIVTALFIAVDLVTNLVRLGRKSLAKGG